MNILHIVRQFHPSIGGLEEYVFNLSIEQINTGHDVEVLTLNQNFQTDEKLPKYEKIHGITVHRIPWIFSKRYSITWIKPSFLNQYDIIHIHAVDFFIDLISLLSKFHLVKPPLQLTTHGGFFHTTKQQGLKKLWFKTITRFSLSNVKKIFTISANDDKLFRQISKHCTLVPNGVRLEKFGPKSQAETNNCDMIYLGRLSSNKKIDWLIEAYGKLEQPFGKLKIIGNSATGDVDYLTECLNQFNANQQIELLLNLSDSDIQKHLSSSKFVVSASEYEGFGLSVIELMSYGLVPFLSNNPDSFVDFIHQSGCGELFNYELNEFPKCYEKLINNWNSQQVTQAIEYSKIFSWPALAKTITEDYQP